MIAKVKSSCRVTFYKSYHMICSHKTKIKFSTVIHIYQNKFYFLKSKTVFTGKGLKC